MAVTLKTIAKKAGVDVSVVSRVLNNKSKQYRISTKRRDQIINITKNLGYMPNSHAQSISRGKFNCLALVCSTHQDRSYLPSRLTDAISNGLEKQSKHLLLAKIPDETRGDLSKMPLVFRVMASDGLLINYTHHMPEELVQAIRDIGLPAIWLNKKLEQDSVYADNIKAAREATGKLIEAGHRNIAYADIYYTDGMMDAHFSVYDRYEGYHEAMLKAGLKPVRFNPETSLAPGEKAVQFFLDILKRPDRPTALLLYWSHSVGALYKAAHLFGLRIPADLSVITFASESSVELGLTVSAMIEPEYEVGEEALRMYQRKEQQGGVMPSCVVDFTYKDMGTCLSPCVS